MCRLGHLVPQGLVVVEFDGAAGVAVDDVSHDVYVVDRGNGRVEKFNEAGNCSLCEFNGSGSPSGLFRDQRKSRSIIRMGVPPETCMWLMLVMV